MLPRFVLFLAISALLGVSVMTRNATELSAVNQLLINAFRLDELKEISSTDDVRRPAALSSFRWPVNSPRSLGAGARLLRLLRHDRRELLPRQ
jgi:hypothetical protein